MKRIKNLIIGIVAVAIVAIVGFFVVQKFGTTIKISHNYVVEKIEAIGKLELVKMHIQDILEYQVVKKFMPNTTAVLIIQGEAVGCVDMQKINRENITFPNDSTINIVLPATEIAYYKVNHEKSRMYDIKNSFFDGAEVLDAAYKEAEKQIEKTALEMGILEQTEHNAVLFFNSFFAFCGFKKVDISFETKKIILNLD